MNYGYIDVFTGDQPASPDIPSTGTRVATIRTNGAPFVVNSQSGGALEIIQGDTGALRKSGNWLLTGVDTGTAGWWRWYWNAFDNDEHTFYYPRMDGLVGDSLILASTSITPATSEAIESFTVQFKG